MERKQVQIKGINRSSQIAQPGECYELINVRRYNKNWYDAKQKKKLKSISEYESFFIHTVNESEHFLSYDIDTGWVLYYEDINNTRPDASFQIEKIDEGSRVRMEMLGNVVMIFDDTNRLTYYMLWDVETSAYRWIGSLPFPVIDVNFNSYIESNSDLNRIIYEFDLSGSYTIESAINSLIGFIYKGYSKWYEKGLFNGYVLAQAAWELFDGSYIKMPVSLIYVSVDPLNEGDIVEGTSKISPMLSVYTDIQDTTRIYKGTRFRAAHLSYSIPNQSILSDLTKYKSIIKSLAIFMSKPVNRFGENAFENGKDSYHVLEYTKEDASITPEKILNDQPLYKVKSIDLKDIAVVSNQIIDSDLTTLQSNEEIQVGELSHGFHASSSFFYNSRIWMAGMSTIFNKWVNPRVNSLGGTTSKKVMFEYKLVTQQGVYWVKSNEITTTNSYLDLPFLISYPDSRATQFRILVKLSNTWREIFTISLTPSLRDNLSFAFIGDLGDLTIDEGTNTFQIQPPSTTAVSTAVRTRFSDVLRMALDEISTSGYFVQALWKYPITETYVNSSNPTKYPIDYNRVQATELNNPFFTMAINSYQVGSGHIQDLAANFIPMTSLQFGQHPVIVLSDDGIYALELGTTTLVTRVSTISQIVAKGKSVNAESIVVFKNDNGLYQIVGREITLISEKLDGLVNMPLDGDELYDVLKGSTVKLSEVDFLTYLEDAILLYDNGYSELIVSNATYPYSYVLCEGMWYKREETFIQHIKSTPSDYCIKKLDETHFDLCYLNEEENKFDHQFIETRDILFFEASCKVDRMLINGMFRAVKTVGPPVSYSAIVLGIWGSNHPEMFNGVSRLLLNAKRFQSTEYYHSLTFSRTVRSGKYFRFVFKSTLEELIFGDIMLDIEPKWTKLY